MTVIVEGMDNSGKTTLVQKIAAFGAELIPSRGKPDGIRAPIEIDRLWNETHARVYDRFVAFSDEVYGRVLRGKNVLDPDPWGAILRTMRSGVLLVYCRPPDGVILNWDGREQMAGVIDNAPKLLQAYDKMVDIIEELGFENQVLRHNYTDPFNEKQMLKEVREHVEAERERHAYAKQLNKDAIRG